MTKVTAWIFRILTGIGAAAATGTAWLIKTSETLPEGQELVWGDVASPIIVLLMVGAFVTGIMQFIPKK